MGLKWELNHPDYRLILRWKNGMMEIDEESGKLTG